MADSVIVNELLCFITNYFGKVPKSELVSSVVGYYDEEEIVAAKELLFEIVAKLPSKVEGIPRIKIRRDSINKRRLDCEDLINLLELLDSQHVELPTFYAVRIDRLPKISPSDVDTVRLAKSVVELKKQVSSLTSQLFDVQKSLETIVASMSPKSARNEQLADDVLPVVNIPTKDFVSGSVAESTHADSFAGLFQTKDDKGQWFVQKQGKAAPQQVTRKILGKGLQQSRQALKAVSVNKPKTWHVFVGRLDPETSDKDVSSYLTDMGIPVSDCKALQKREKWQEKYAAFRVVIRFEDKDKIFEDNLWPLGVDVRDWIFTNSNQNGS